MKKTITLLLVLLSCALVQKALNAQVVAIGISSLGAEKIDTTPRPPQVVSTFPANVSDEVLLGADSLKSSISELDISFGTSRSASAKTSTEGAELSTLRNEVQVLREEVKALREEVKELREIKWRKKRLRRHR